ncbi:kinase-like domain-containing protein [Helicostylum pulchrum]|nr:kinase-like domain-containing protein [Helicostylum pulchrum]
MTSSQKDVIVAEQWLVLSKIGEGSFGEVFKAKDINLGRLYAVKRESLDLEHPQLRHESKIYDILAGGPCIPKCHWYGQHDGFDCIVIDLLGSNLKQFQQITRTMPLDLIIDFGCQLVACLEHIHDKGIVYRDVKPENFLFEASCVLPDLSYTNNSPPPSPPTTTCNDILDNTRLYAVDFGLATWWRNPHTMKPYAECKKPIKYKTGTARYASLNIHRGRTHARRDDMESLGYLLLDLLLNGDLPWSGITARSTKVGWDRLKAIKEDMSLQDMCAGLPCGIMNFIDYTRRLRFADRPDYDHLKTLLIGCNQRGPFSKLVTASHNTRPIPSPAKYYQQQNYHLKRNSSHHMHKMNYLDPSPAEDGVFVMDDLAKELPSFTKKQNNSTYYRNNNRSSSNSSNRHYHYGHKKHYGSKVGWNTHKNYTSAIEKTLQTP